MKRIIFLLLILILVVSGCSSTGHDNDAGKTAPTVSKLTKQGKDSTGETKKVEAKEAKGNETPAAGEADNNSDEPPVTGGYALIDWVDFIKFNGIDYHVAGTNTLPTGKKLDTVKFNVSENVHNPNYKTKDGDASFLDEGTPIYEVKGYNPDFRLAAGNKLYEAMHNPKAKSGRDLLDITNKVVYIGINSETDGKTELGSIKNRAEVEELVNTILSSPVKEQSDLYDGPRYFLCFYLKDGTSLTRVFFTESGALQSFIMLPEKLGEKIKSAVK